jgi:DNA-binding NtrC family response regulator
MNEINDAGIYRILTKPCDTDKLNATISEALGQRARDGDTQTPRVPVLTVPKPKGALAALEAKYPGITQPESDQDPTY